MVLSKTVAVGDGTKLHVEMSGHGDSLIAISGLGGAASFWDSFVEGIGEGVRTVRFDQRGIGNSERGLQPISIETLAQDTWDVLDALKIVRPILCGHSTGGAIVQEMALMRPDAASGLVLSGTWAGPNEFMEALFDIRLDLLMRAPKKYAALTVLAGWPTRWLRDHPEVIAEARTSPPDTARAMVIRERIHALLAHNRRERLPTVKVPTLILGAQDDQIVPNFLQEELATLLPNAKSHVFANGGHFFPVTQSNDMARIVQDWVGR